MASKVNTRSAKHLTNLLGDVRRQNNFILTIEGVTPNTNIDLVVQDMFLPKFSLQVIELRLGNSSVKLPGAAQWEGGQLTLLDTLSRKELNAMNTWLEETYDFETDTIKNSGGYNGTNGFKKLGYVTEYAADGSYTRKWELRGLWISKFDPGVLNAANADLKQLSFTIEIDPSPIAPTYGNDSEWDDGLELDEN